MTAAEWAVAREILRLVRQGLAPDASPDDARLVRWLDEADPRSVSEPDPPWLLEPLASRLDSLRLLALVVAVEDRFRVVLTDDDAAGARSLGDLARLVAARADPAALSIAATRSPA